LVKSTKQFSSRGILNPLVGFFFLKNNIFIEIYNVYYQGFQIHINIIFKISLLISSLACWLFRNMFNFHESANFPKFLLLLIPSFLPLWLEKLLHMISVFLNLLRLVSCPKLWSWIMFYVYRYFMYLLTVSTQRTIMKIT
jgi:hypothetical protein